MLRREVVGWARRNAIELAQTWSGALGRPMHASSSRVSTVDRTLDRGLVAGVSSGTRVAEILVRTSRICALRIPFPRRFIANSFAIHRIFIALCSHGALGKRK